MSLRKCLDRILLLALTAFAAFIATNVFAQHAAAQGQRPVVYLTQIAGSIDSLPQGSQSKYRITVSGKVVNTLPFDVGDVSISLQFPEDAQSPLLVTTVSSVTAGKTSDFLATKYSNLKLTSFNSSVTEYVALSGEVKQLVEYFRATDDMTLKKAIARGFSRMKVGALPALVECIDTSSRITPASSDQVTTDLFCLDALTAIGDPSAVKPLLDLLAWYSINGNNESYQRAISVASVNRNDPLNVLLIFKSTVTPSLPDLISNSIVRLGKGGIPALLRAISLHQSETARQTAQKALIAMGKGDLSSLLNESDQSLFGETLVALSESKRTDAIVPMLEFSDTHVSAQKAIDQSILAMKDSAVGPLVQALGHRRAKVSDHSEFLLRQLAPQTITALREQLKNLKGELPGEETDPSMLVDYLVADARGRLDSQIDSTFDRAWQLSHQENCIEATREADKIFEIRDDTTRHATEISLIYLCGGQALISEGKYEDAISVLRHAHSLNPQDSSILLELGRAESAAGYWAQSVKDLRNVVNLQSNNVKARQALWFALAGSNPLFLVLGLAIVLVMAFVLAPRSST